MKTFQDFDSQGEYKEFEPFSIIELHVQWGNMDQILIDSNKRIKNCIVEFKTPKIPTMESKTVKVKASGVLYKRFVNQDGKLGNVWRIITAEGEEIPLSVSCKIKTYRKINKNDPFGEEDWGE
jgi:hypothetical protein